MSENLPVATKELNWAKESLENLKNSKSLDEVEKYWIELLNYLEKVWTKSERECQSFKNKFEPWQGKYKKLRKIDPLLKYLKQARDSDQHSIQETVEKIGREIGIGAPEASGGYIKEAYIKEMRIENGVITKYVGSPNIIMHYPERLQARSVINHGETFSPPAYHRGKPIKKGNHPISIAQMGITFYEEYLNEIDKSFF